ncbi:amino acid kinase family protein, partial [mine drainage metagenome]
WIRNTFAPDKPGTLICARPESRLPVKGITSIEQVALVNLEGAGMIGVPGTAHRLFGALREEGIGNSDLPGQLRAFDLLRHPAARGRKGGAGDPPRIRARAARGSHPER